MPALSADADEEGNAALRHPSSVVGLCTEEDEFVDEDAVDILGVMAAGLGRVVIRCLDDARVGVCGRPSPSSEPSSFS
jgi:hypothetical protein